MQEFTELANMLADASGAIIRKYYRQDFTIDHKEDESPVTVADREAEKAIREILEDKRPEDGILGEEFGRKDSRNGYTWVIDPIDGTKPFIVGRPTFGTLIALCRDDIPVLGVIDQPVLRERWIGMKGEGATFNGAPCKTRPCKDLKSAVCSSTSPGMFFHMPPGFIEDWKNKSRFIIWGADCYSYGLMAMGSVDVIIEADMQPYDYLALVPVIEAAGGKVTDWRGNDITLDSGDTVLAVGDPVLLDQALKIVNQA